MPVGHIWKFDLEQRLVLIFGWNDVFSKIIIESVMLKFLAISEYEKVKSEEPNNNRGKVIQKIGA